MANTTSAKKATRKIARRTAVNKSRRTQMRVALRSGLEARKAVVSHSTSQSAQLPAAPAL